MRVLLVAAFLMAGLVTVGVAATIPPGSYQGTCTNIQVQKLIGGPGQNLSASCQRKNGNYVDANLALPCTGDIENRNGKLACVAGDNPFAPPSGSYQTSCRNANMAGPILRATCQAPGGMPAETTINTLNCRGSDIRVNGKGKLTC